MVLSFNISLTKHQPLGASVSAQHVISCGRCGEQQTIPKIELHQFRDEIISVVSSLTYKWIEWWEWDGMEAYKLILHTQQTRNEDGLHSGHFDSSIVMHLLHSEDEKT